MNNFLLHAKVFHKRLRPRVNQFTYPVFYLCFPLSQRETLPNRFLSLNRFNLFSFYDKDHGDLEGSDLLAWIKAMLVQEGISEADGEVILLAHPRLLGYVFNPVSFWYCLDKQENLRAVLAEVNNTFGERHLYLVTHPDNRPILPEETLTSRKVFHVSPFMPVEGEYHFRFHVTDQNALAVVNFDDNEGPILLTSVAGKRRELSAKTLAGLFFAYPLMTLMVVYRIHFQAVKLWFKKVKYIRKPQPPETMLSK